MSSTKEGVGVTSFFAGTVAISERELAIDEDISAVCLFPSSHFVPDSNVVVKEVEKCVRRALEERSASDGQAGEARKGDSFVDIMGSLEKETGG